MICKRHASDKYCILLELSLFGNGDLFCAVTDSHPRSILMITNSQISIQNSLGLARISVLKISDCMMILEMSTTTVSLIPANHSR